MNHQTSVTETPTKYDLIGNDIRLILGTDNTHTGRLTVEWKCRTGLATSSSINLPSSTIEMAQALLTGAFTPSMAIDYGCAGRGFFDPFAPTIGSHTDEIDGFFFEWKKCVQCATENSILTTEPYSYSINDDSCGKLLALNI